VGLDDHAPVVGDVPSAGGEERGPHRDVRRVDQVRCQQHRVEPAAKREILDPCAHGLRASDVPQHVRGLVNRHDLVTERDQRMGNAPGPAAEFEDGRSRPGRVMHDGGFTEVG